MKCTAVVEVDYLKGVVGQEPCPVNAIRDEQYCDFHYDNHMKALGYFWDGGAMGWRKQA